MAEKTSIKKSKMNGEDAKKIVPMKIKHPGNLAVDAVEEKLYWTDTVLQRIDWTDLSGTKHRGNF